MGYFLAVSAFRDQSIESVASHTISYASKFGAACKSVGPGKMDERLDTIIFAPQNGWTVVLWPQYFNVHDIELCRSLSQEMPSLVSTVHVYDDNYWVNAVFDKGNTVSLFASNPGYSAESENPDDRAEKMKAKWSGNASAISHTFAEYQRRRFAVLGPPGLVKIRMSPARFFPDDEDL